LSVLKEPFEYFMSSYLFITCLYFGVIMTQS